LPSPSTLSRARVNHNVRSSRPPSTMFGRRRTRLFNRVGVSDGNGSNSAVRHRSEPRHAFRCPNPCHRLWVLAAPSISCLIRFEGQVLQMGFLFLLETYLRLSFYWGRQRGPRCLFKFVKSARGEPVSIFRISRPGDSDGPDIKTHRRSSCPVSYDGVSILYR